MGIFLLLIFTGLLLKYLRHLARKRLFARMKKWDSAIAPVPQFFAEMRKMEREIDFTYGGKLEGAVALPFVEKFDHALRLYLTRQFEIPAFEWTSDKVAKDFRERYAWFGEELQLQLKVLMLEIEKTRKTEKQITLTDVQQLLKNLKRWVDRTSYYSDKMKFKVGGAR